MFKYSFIASLTGAALAAGGGFALAQDGPGEDANVAVTRVTLLTGGLAHVEGRMGSAGEVMRLAVERPQVADVLRTLVVTGSAPVVSVDLEAAEPVGERSVTGRLLAGDLADPETVLTSLIGETVDLRGGTNEVSGRLLAFNRVAIPGEGEAGDKPGVRVAVATAEGRVAYATFASLDSLSIEGAAVQARMDGVVPALGATVDPGRRDLLVRLSEPATAGFSFVVPTTVWRPSYRALIGEDGEVSLQGWATLENTTGLDWSGVDLRLGVGTPVAYSQDVYAPLRTSRPVAPFQVGRTARTADIPAEERESFADESVAAAAPAPAVMGRAFAAQRSRAIADRPADLVTGGPANAGSASTVFPVAGRIDLASGRTLSVPFLSASDTVDRIVFLDRVAGGEPMDALEMSFDPEATVPGGLVAVYDGDSFAGDARFQGADGGEVRILPFALSADLDVRITSDGRQTLSRASFAEGAFRVTREMMTETTFILSADDAVTFVVDEARVSNETMDVAAPDGVSVDLTRLGRDRVRLRAELPKGRTEIVVRGTRPLMEFYGVGDVPPNIIEEVLSVGGVVDAETRQRLLAIAALRAEIAGIDRRVATVEADIADLRVAVAADRDNLEAIDVKTPEGARVRKRIIERGDLIDTALQELRDLRRKKLEAERTLLGG